MITYFQFEKKQNYKLLIRQLDNSTTRQLGTLATSPTSPTSQFYQLLIAFTGSILAALDAGMIPATIPTTKQMITVVMIIGRDK